MIFEIERQARILDRVTPDWSKRIDGATLDSDSIRVCALGQIYGSWGDQPREIRSSSTAYLGMCLFWRTRWVMAAKRRGAMTRLRDLDLRPEPLYVPSEWEISQVPAKV